MIIAFLAGIVFFVIYVIGGAKYNVIMWVALVCMSSYNIGVFATEQFVCKFDPDTMSLLMRNFAFCKRLDQMISLIFVGLLCCGCVGTHPMLGILLANRLRFAGSDCHRAAPVFSSVVLLSACQYIHVVSDRSLYMEDLSISDKLRMVVSSVIKVFVQSLQI